MTGFHTDLCDLFGIRYPIVLAGMGGPATPELAAAVSNAGGLGVLGAAALSGGELEDWIRRTRELTSEPFGVDTLIPASVPEEIDEAAIRAAIPQRHIDVVQGIRDRYSLPAPEERGAYELPALSRQFYQEQMDALIDCKVPVYAAGLGDPTPYVPRLHGAGIKVIGLVGAVRHARKAVAGGVDAVVAQGHEAGGHNSSVGTMVLVPAVVDAVGDRVPVIAAGGIGDGRGIIAALALGARGVWMGTRFLATPEAGIPDGQKQRLLQSTEEDTIVHRYVSGKPMRTLRTPIPKELEDLRIDPLPMPQMGILAGPLWAGAEEAGRYDLSPGPAGQIAGSITRITSAAEVMESLVREAGEALEALAETGPGQ